MAGVWAGVWPCRQPTTGEEQSGCLWQLACRPREHKPRLRPAVPAPPAPACVAGKETVNSMFGTRVAVLAGDFLFAQSSWFLANLDNMEVRERQQAGWLAGCAGA